MKTYKEFRPSPHDVSGLGLDDQQDWLVVPVFQNRDSEALELSNFRVIQADLERVQAENGDPTSEEADVEVHRFGHWANGWFEIILVRPESPAAKRAEYWEEKLENYPIADENDFSELEFEQENGESVLDESWMIES